MAMLRRSVHSEVVGGVSQDEQDELGDILHKVGWAAFVALAGNLCVSCCAQTCGSAGWHDGNLRRTAMTGQTQSV